ncbi:kinase, pfkB family protein [Besnoitia besnoiti]|uniref:Ribokinase n=1 Tax=Besnoitia besnoiti TaxID=94643 RepID=A0A2A9M7F0_BESBE|nr:kinase, pfkB family protein [Besnoitia besnoiti]PFH31593.1 kinase, pfkB family protein [Besnoitia besnoiti]
MSALDTPATSLATRDPLDVATAAAAAQAVHAVVEKVESANIVVLGCINRDVTLRVRALPAFGETIFGESVEIYHGGKAANQAVQAALLMPASDSAETCKAPAQAVEEGRRKEEMKTKKGGRVALVCKLGNDAVGREYREYLQARSIDTRGVLTAESCDTGCAFVTVARDGENTIVYVHGANKSLTARDLQDPEIVRLIQQCKVFVCENGVAGDVIVAGLRIAKSAPDRVLTIFTPAPAVDVPLAAFAYTDVVVLNESEARELWKLSPVKQTQDTAGNVFEEPDTAKEEFPTLRASAAATIQHEGLSLQAFREKLLDLGFRATHVAGATEPAAPTGGGSCEGARRGLCNVVLSKGKAGCALCESDAASTDLLVSSQVHEIPQKRQLAPTDVVDTVGAGDSFCGALAYFLGHEDMPLREAAEKACIVASYSVQKRGASESYADRAKLTGVLF